MLQRRSNLGRNAKPMVKDNFDDFVRSRIQLLSLLNIRTLTDKR